jgi:predicted RNA-binding protein YlxR (DUF448 family)
MARGGRDSDREGPERRCIATGESQPKGGLVRFVVGPEGRIMPDVAGRLPGRGIYVAADRAALETAARKKLFARAARAPVVVPEGLPDLVEALLAQRLIETLSLAHKAGQALAGFEKARDLVASGRAAVLVQAADGSARGKRKLRVPPNAAHVDCLTATELGLSFGRDRVIHAAVVAGGLARRIVEEAARLARLRVGADGRETVTEE